MCKEEFQLKNFGFNDCKEEMFYSFQFILPWKWIFPLYRFIVWIYMGVWLILHASHPDVQGTFHYYLTNWAEVFHVFYLLLALISSFYGYTKRTQSSAAMCGEENANGRLTFFFKLQWLSFTVTADIVVVVVVLFWGLAAPNLPASVVTQPIFIHLHVVNLLLLMIDIAVISIPVRLLHVAFSIVVALIYVLTTLILHWLDIISEIYPGVLNWEGNPTDSALYCLLSLAVLVVAHLFVFGLYKLRIFIFTRCQNNADVHDIATISGIHQAVNGQTVVAHSHQLFHDNELQHTTTPL